MVGLPVLLGTGVSLAFQRIDMHDDGMRRILHGGERPDQSLHVVAVGDIAIIEAHRPEEVAGAVSAALAQLLQIAVEPAVILGNGHLVVVHDDDEIRAQFGSVVQPLERLASAQRSVADDGHDIPFAALQVAGFGQSARQTDRRRGVADNEVVVFALRRFGITRNPVVFRRIEERPAASGQHLVHVTLVRNVKDELVFRRIENIVQGHSRLDHAQIGPEVPAVRADLVQQRFTDLTAQQGEFPDGKPFHICRGVDFLQIHIVSVFIRFVPSARRRVHGAKIGWFVQ